MNLEYADVLRVLRRDDAAVRACVRVGSRVYGTAHEGSDRDYLVVLLDGALPVRQDLLWGPSINVVVHGEASYAAALANQSVFALEAYFAPDAHRLKAPAPPFAYVRDRKKLVVAATERADADWRKAQKVVAEDPAAAQTRAGHALRVLAFAVQIATGGRIEDFHAGRALREMLAPCTNGPALERAFIPLRDALVADLRRQAKAR